MIPGSVVQCRNRDWVLPPTDEKDPHQKDLFLLRPLTGATDEVVAVHKRLLDPADLALRELEDIL